MTTSTITPPTSPASRARVPLRLQLNAKLGDGSLDGSWWPQSRDLSVELADLVDHFPSEHGLVYRAVFSRPDWDAAPHRVRVNRGPIKVGSFPHDDTHQIWLTMSTHRMIGLAVESPVGPEPPGGRPSTPATEEVE
jgi:hypothetical protein